MTDAEMILPNDIFDIGFGLLHDEININMVNNIKKYVIDLFISLSPFPYRRLKVYFVLSSGK